MTPIVVTAHMAEPVITHEDGIHLDGLVAYGAFCAMGRDAREQLPYIGGPWAHDFDLPLERWRVKVESFTGDARMLDEEGRVWGFAASRARFEGVPLRRVHELRKRVPTHRMTRWTSAKSVHIGLGPGKAYDLPLPTVWAPRITWTAIGDGGAVLHLLDHLHGIGKKCDIGMGRVLRWEVEPGTHTMEDVLANRRMPVSSPALATGFGSVRPPYSHVSRRMPCTEGAC